MSLSVISDGDVEEVLKFVSQGTATPWPLKAWLGCEMGGVVARHQRGEVIGVLPLCPRTFCVLGLEKRILFCSAVKVSEDRRGEGIGSRMIDLASEAFCGDGASLAVVRSDPESPASRWYLANGFRPIVDVVSHVVTAETTRQSSEVRVSIWPLDPTLAVHDHVVDKVLSLPKDNAVAYRIPRSFSAWRSEIASHYYMEQYEAPHVFSAELNSEVLVGLACRTKMRGLDRFDVLDFEFSGTEHFSVLATSIGSAFADEFRTLTWWNMSEWESSREGVLHRWPIRWRTQVFLHGTEGGEHLVSRYRNSVSWQYRQMEFV